MLKTLKVLFFMAIFSIFAYADNCQNCHKNYGSLDKHHLNISCHSCHGGKRYATHKNEAHEGMVKNTSYFQHAQIFCIKCHEKQIKRVLISPMKSQIGIRKVLREQWVEKSSSKMSKSELKNLADSHYEKACASCHLNQKEEIFYDKSLSKGGGCAACHRVEKKKGVHPKFSTKIPSKNCIKCHNRSNRIGLSYFGKFESEGYGTPYKNGEFSHRLDKNRFFYELPSDVHHQKLGLECIDCHTHKGVMGDGKGHLHMEDGVDIHCEDCHNADFKAPNKMAKKLILLNQNLPIPEKIAYTHKKHGEIYNLQKNGKKEFFYKKSNGKRFDFSQMSDNAYHTNAIHQRLDCSACHSQWIASCYGCHEVYFKNGKQYSWVKKKITKGSWREFRSFLRFEKPSLGVGYNKKIMPYAPGCQVLGTVFKDKSIEQFHSLAMASWSPHTSGKSRECVDCHFSSESLGLGRGNLDLKNGKIFFSPFYISRKNKLPISYPIDAFIDVNGTQFQTTSRQNARGFNSNEVKKIVNAYKCIVCHRKWEDKIYRDFNRSLEIFEQKGSQCLE